MSVLCVNRLRPFPIIDQETSSASRGEKESSIFQMLNEGESLPHLGGKTCSGYSHDNSSYLSLVLFRRLLDIRPKAGKSRR